MVSTRTAVVKDCYTMPAPVATTGGALAEIKASANCGND